MNSNPQQPATAGSPPKPWEKSGGSSDSGPFKPPSPGSTSDVVNASGTARPGEIVTAGGTAAMNANAVGRPLPSRPWEQQNYGSTIGGIASGSNYNSGYGSGMYGSSYGGGLGGSYGGALGGSYGGALGGSYGGGGLYGNSMYNRGGYGSGLYGNSGMYGGGMYGGAGGLGGFGGQMGGYGMGTGMGMGMGPYGEQDPNNPFGGPPSPPGFWVSFLRVMQGVVNCFGRISILVDQNTQAFAMFMSALLQLFDRSGVLYGELARFVLRLMGIKPKPRKMNQPGPGGFPGPGNPHGNQNYIEGPKAAPSGQWDNVWGEN